MNDSVDPVISPSSSNLFNIIHANTHFSDASVYDNNDYADYHKIAFCLKFESCLLFQKFKIKIQILDCRKKSWFRLIHIKYIVGKRYIFAIYFDDDDEEEEMLYGTARWWNRVSLK